MLYFQETKNTKIERTSTFKELFAETGQVRTLTFENEREETRDPYVRATDDSPSTTLTNTCSLNSSKSLLHQK